MIKIRKRLSKRSWQDAYYDGDIGFGESFDEDSQEVVSIPDYWKFKISSSEKGYAEDVNDDWYSDLMNKRV